MMPGRVSGPTVCVVKATGYPLPDGGDAKRIADYLPGSCVWISSSFREIIERYYKFKQEISLHLPLINLNHELFEIQ
jgi:hypothetical protein